MKSFLFILILLSCIGSATGQWTMKFQPNVSIPVSLIDGTHLNGGFGFNVTVGYTVVEELVVHAGWGKNVFAAERSELHRKNGFEESRLILGAQFFEPLMNQRFKIMAGAGFITSHIEQHIVTENRDVAGRSTGWYAESGISYQFLSKFSIMPQLTYTYQSAKLNNDNRILLKYLSPGLSFAYSLGD